MSSQSPLFTVIASRARTSQLSSSPSPDLTTPPAPNLYVTYKVLQLQRKLLERFRKRVRTRRSDRVLKKETLTRVTRDFSQDLERQAFEEIDRYLGRKTAGGSRKRPYPVVKHKWTGENERKRDSIVDASPRQDRDQSSSRSTQWLLNELDRSVKSESKALIAIAKDHELFVTRKIDFRIDRLSLTELAQLLVVVKDLLSTLRRVIVSRAGVKTLVEDNELLALDESIAANFEHLLLCLKNQLIQLLVLKLVDLVRKDLVECQRDQYRHHDDFFFEFPDAQHPLNTTWPWSIKPSLAVIWGVCWMFYGPEDSWLTDDRLRNLTNEAFDDMLQQTQQPRDQDRMYSPGAQVIHRPTSLHNAVANVLGEDLNVNFGEVHFAHGAGDGPGRPDSPHLTSFNHAGAHHRPVVSPQQHEHGGLIANHLHSQPALSSAPDQLTGPYTTYTQSTQPQFSYAVAPSAAAASAQTSQYPQANSLPHHLSGSGSDQDDPYNVVGQWNLNLQATPAQHFQHDNSWQGQISPLHSRNPPIRIITELPPQASPYHSAIHSARSAHSLTPNSASVLQRTPYNHYGPNLSPRNAHIPMNPPDDTSMQHTPPPDSANMGDHQQLSRKRSHEQMISESAQFTPAQANMDGHSDRAGSVSSQAPEYSSPQNRSIAVKRGNAPINDQGKLICEYDPACTGMTFDRKCEWSKHMDKHDRPYRCQREECAKLQGFTYSGGLLRHEREVHNKHGGPKAKLVCPHPECKRHTGKGFTRKENLNEHVRRVHENKENQQFQAQGPSQFKHEAVDGSMGAIPQPENAETPYYTQLDPHDTDSPVHKRSRYAQGEERSASEDVEVESLRHEILRLQNEHREKDDLMQQMQEEIVQLNSAVALMRQPQMQQDRVEGQE